jgi:hypothetical protein
MVDITIFGFDFYTSMGEWLSSSGYKFVSVASVVSRSAVRLGESELLIRFDWIPNVIR